MEQGLPFRTRFKYIESLGISIRETLVRKDPEPRECGRENCLPCRGKQGTA